jgi:hypothetical protein
MSEGPSFLTTPPLSNPEPSERGIVAKPPMTPYREPGVIVEPRRPVPAHTPPPVKRRAVVEEDVQFGIGDSGSEHLGMTRGRYSAWMYVVMAFIGEAFVLGAIPMIAFRYLFHFFTEDSSYSIGAGFVVGAVLAYIVFRDRWRCIEAFSSRFCSGLMNLSMLYVPVVAFMYANTRGIAKLRGN